MRIQTSVFRCNVSIEGVRRACWAGRVPVDLSVSVVCDGLGYPCGASHGTRGSHKAGRPRISERCISQGPRIDDDVAYVEGGGRPRSRA